MASKAEFCESLGGHCAIADLDGWPDVTAAQVVEAIGCCSLDRTCH